MKYHLSIVFSQEKAMLKNDRNQLILSIKSVSEIPVLNVCSSHIC